MARSFGSHFVITANTTDEGGPVYLQADRKWSTVLGEAHATTDETERDELLTFAHGDARTVCDPYAFRANVEDGRPVATTAREQIRAAGPTTPIRRPD